MFISSSSSSNSDSSNSDDSEYQRLLQEALDAADEIQQRAIRRKNVAHVESSRTGRRQRYIERGREQGFSQLYRDYFADPPTYPERIFRRRFRMSSQLFKRIVERLEHSLEFFQQRPDASSRLGISSLQKCTCALRMLAYGTAADASDEYLRNSEETARVSLEHFVDGIITFFGNEYLRRPSAEDTQRLLSVAASRGFPGMLGSIDCMQWRWKNYPTAWKGQYARGHGHSTIILEAVVSYDLWFWHAFFGVAGTSNDLNVLDQSPVFDDVLEGRAPNVSYTVNGNEYNMGYYLTDGIYPKWSTFVQSIRLPQGNKAKLFAQYQEAVRKDVERGFGVLQARFTIIRNPSLSWDPVKIGKIMRTCVILHNMIVENERDTYSHHGYEIPEFGEGLSGETHSVNNQNWAYSTDIPQNIRASTGGRWSQIRSSITHHRLQEDLKENIWQLYGKD